MQCLNYFNNLNSNLHFYQDQYLLPNISGTYPELIYTSFNQNLPLSEYLITMSAIKIGINGILQIENMNLLPFGRFVKLGSEQQVFLPEQTSLIQMEANDIIRFIYYYDFNSNLEINLEIFQNLWRHMGY